MRKTGCLIVCLALVTVLAAAVGQEEKEIRLTLQDCILTALKNNLGVEVAVLSPKIADGYVAWTKEKFLPRLSLSFSKQNTNSASFSWIEAAEKATTSYNDFSAQVFQLIPTGGSFSVSLSSYKNDSNLRFQTINPRYGSTLNFGFFQPLLRNSGFKMSRRDIILSQNNREISENQLKSLLLDTIYGIENAYWNLIFAVETLEVRKQSLQLARDLLAKNRREVEIGMVAPIEILSAEAEVATREADILQAEVIVENSEDLLKTSINLKPEQGSVKLRIIPLDEPSGAETRITPEEALRLALDNRPDLDAARLDLKNKELTLEYAKNQLLPDLNVHISYWSPGISGTQILYENNNPLTGVITGKFPRGSSDALRDALGFKYNNWSLGLTLGVPLQNLMSRAQYSVYKTVLEQSRVQLKNHEEQVFLEIRNSVRNVQTNYKRIQAYRLARELAENKLEAEEKKLKVGLTTNYMVLQHQRDLANARSAELKAVIDYNLSLAYLDKVLGTTFQTKNIKLSDHRPQDPET